ncbi:MAG: selenocysteine-specific translation elongation factor [Heliobacteriaceae bacterium]|nr:selenocysteine-specific translation elongation factor [Heliobacteriaceae bacterium]
MVRERTNVIVGTAGHVDHGKTALVRALTGINTDRLKEEKARGISIELGFAPFVLPDGKLAGIVDVPGHERFVKQMVAGAGGMDLVLLVIAADEGVMPQTREHLDVLELLQVSRGIVVLTKVDLVDDEWLELVIEEVKEALAGSVMAVAPIVTVSAVTGAGIPELRDLITEMVATVPRRPAAGMARLPIDRVFTSTGFGTVVTGTLVAGTLQLGDQLELMPRRLPVRIRSLQVHGQKLGLAAAGQRVAVNLHGVELTQVERGDVVATVDTLTPAYRVSVRLQILKRTARPVKERDRVRFHAGTRETLGRVVLLDREELAPGAEAFAQIVLEEPVAVLKGDRFVLRSYSPVVTIGGGRVVEGSAAKFKKNRPEVIRALETKEKGTPVERLAQYLAQSGLPLSPEEAVKAVGLSREVVKEIISQAQAGTRLGIALLTGEGTLYFLAPEKLNLLAKAVVRDVTAFHQAYPLRRGMPKEDLKGKMVGQWPGKAYSALLATLAQQGVVMVAGNILAAAGFTNTPESGVAGHLELVEGWFAAGGVQPPTPAEVKERLQQEKGVNPEAADEYLAFLVEERRLTKLGEDLFFHPKALAHFREAVTAYLAVHGEATVAAIRDATGSSRRYVVPLLEWLDRERVTRRFGDKRRLFSRPGP